MPPLNLSLSALRDGQMPHRACGNCGYHTSKVSIEIKAEEK
jgi:Zn ribbon nucleic-acid-binding protein